MSASTPVEDGGSAFPHPELHDSIPMPDGEYRHLPASTGMNKREYAAIRFGAAWAGVLGTGEMTENHDQRAVEAARLGLAQADALLAALSEPAPEPEPVFPTFSVYAASAPQRAAVKRIADSADFSSLPTAIRTYVREAVAAIEAAEADEDQIPF